MGQGKVKVKSVENCNLALEMDFGLDLGLRLVKSLVFSCKLLSLREDQMIYCRLCSGC